MRTWLLDVIGFARGWLRLGMWLLLFVCTDVVLAFLCVLNNFMVYFVRLFTPSSCMACLSVDTKFPHILVLYFLKRWTKCSRTLSVLVFYIFYLTIDTFWGSLLIHKIECILIPNFVLAQQKRIFFKTKSELEFLCMSWGLPIYCIRRWSQKQTNPKQLLCNNNKNALIF